MHRAFFLAPFFALPFVLMFMWIVVALLLFVFWIWMLIEAATKEPSQGNEKIVWILVIIFTNWLGALIYFFARRPERIRTCGK